MQEWFADQYRDGRLALCRTETPLLPTRSGNQLPQDELDGVQVDQPRVVAEVLGFLGRKIG